MSKTVTRSSGLSGLSKMLGILLIAAFLVGVGDMLLGDSNAFAVAGWVDCTPSNVVTYHNRVHIRCVQAVGGVQFFAVSTADSANAARVLSVMTAAHALGRTATILYDPADTSGTQFGCQATDCRVIQAIGFWQ